MYISENYRNPVLFEIMSKICQNSTVFNGFLGPRKSDFQVLFKTQLQTLRIFTKFRECMIYR